MLNYTAHTEVNVARTAAFYREAGWWDGLLALVALGVILALAFAWPGNLLDKVDHAAYAVCHRIPERSYAIAGRTLPLCARCSGTYLGALAGLAVLAIRGRGRASGLPAARHSIVLGGLLFAWAADGANSYLSFFPGLPHLYEPNNLLRLATGALQGAVIAAFLLPVFNLTLWKNPSPTASVGNWRDLAWLAAGAAAVVGLVSSEWAPLLYPLALLSGLLIVLLIGCVNGIVVFSLLHRDGRALRWRQVAAPLLTGIALAMIELTAIGLVRAALTERFGLPF
jgi:uncharacterized membrane protein